MGCAASKPPDSKMVAVEGAQLTAHMQSVPLQYLRAEMDRRGGGATTATVEAVALAENEQLKAQVSNLSQRLEADSVDLLWPTTLAQATSMPDGEMASMFRKTEELPDGVDLGSLAAGGDNKFTPLEAAKAYAAALKTSGGQKKLAQYKEAADKLVGIVTQKALSGKQNSAWETYSVEDFLDITTKGPLRQYGESQIAKYQAALKEKKLTCKIAVPSGKAIARSKMKVVIKYGGDTSRLVDANRCTVECKSIDELFSAVETAVGMWNDEKGVVVELEDKFFNRCMEAGYRHVQMLVRFGACLWEIQFNTTDFLKAKHECGHKAYKTTRHVQESLLLFAISNQPVKLHAMLCMPGIREIADPDVVADKNGMRALHHAAFRGSTESTKLLLSMPKPADVFKMDSYAQLPIKLAMLNLHWEYAEEALLPAMKASATRIPKNTIDEKLVGSVREARDYVRAINPTNETLPRALEGLADFFNSVIQERLQGLSKHVGGRFSGGGEWKAGLKNKHMILPARESDFEFSAAMQPKGSFSFGLHFLFSNTGTTRNAAHMNVLASCHGNESGWEFRYERNKFILMCTFNKNHTDMAFNSLDGSFMKGWHQALWMLDADDHMYYLYIDGKKVSKSRYSGSYSAYGGHLMVGNNPEWRDRNSFCGEVKNILCVDRLLEDAEITTHALAAED